MKSLALAAGIAALALPMSAAQGGIITIGEGFARSCYDASEAQIATPATRTCPGAAASHRRAADSMRVSNTV